MTEVMRELLKIMKKENIEQWTYNLWIPENEMTRNFVENYTKDKSHVWPLTYERYPDGKTGKWGYFLYRCSDNRWEEK